MRRPPTPIAACLLVALALSSPAPAAGGQALLPPGFSDHLVLAGLDQPVGMVQLPDGRVLVVEQKSARVRVILDGSLVAPDPVGTVDQVRTTGPEQGLLGIAVDPGWPARPYVYVHCDDVTGPRIRVSRYTMTGDVAATGTGGLTLDVGSRYDLVRDVPDNAGNHNGGTLRFGPDGMLYASFGEDADPCGAQDTTALKGTILRLDVSRLPAGPGIAPRALITPPGNPYATSPDSNRRLMWLKGLRNPFRFSIDPANGTLFIGDVGQNTWEEIDRAPTGGLNFGWPLFEGNAPYTTCAFALPAPLAPIATYDHTQGDAVVGGVLYRAPVGAIVPFPAEYEGRFLFSDYYTGLLRVLTDAGAGWALVPGTGPSDWATGLDAVSDYFVGRDGAVWYCRQSVAFAAASGEIRRIVYGPDTSAGGASGRTGVDFAPPFPSPAPGHATFAYSLPGPARVSMRLFDATGRQVRLLVPLESQSAPGRRITWDGRDDAGDPLPSGLYFADLEVDGVAHVRRVALAR